MGGGPEDRGVRGNSVVRGDRRVGGSGGQGSQGKLRVRGERVLGLIRLLEA